MYNKVDTKMLNSAGDVHEPCRSSFLAFRELAGKSDLATSIRGGSPL